MAPAPLESMRVKRSVSFELLRRDVANDDEFDPPGEELQKRRRRRSKSKKRGKLQESLSLSLSLSPMSSADLEATVIGLELPAEEGSDVTTEANGFHCPSEASETGSVHAGEFDGSKTTDLEGNVDVEDSATSAVVPLLHSPSLRQRPVMSNVPEGETGESEVGRIEPEGGRVPLTLKPTFQAEGGGVDWKELMTDTEEYPAEAEFTPVQYVLDELREGNALEITTRTGNEQSRERVYNVLFNVPWRCELLIDVGFFVCLDSFLSMLTVVPVRLFLSFVNRLRRVRSLRANDWCDISCLVILIAGVKALQQADISFIYHSIRFEPNIKLYVIYNMLEVFDKLFQSFGVDVIEVLFNSASKYTAEKTVAEFLKLLFDQCIAVGCFILHSFIILFEAITLAAALHHAATNRSLLMLLMSNNFAEIKSNVFKRFNKDNLHSLAHNDTVERFHILTCLFFVFVQNIMIVEGPWMSSFFLHAAMVMICESFVDLIKHSFLAKFNQVKPAAYSEFLRTLCEQVVKNRRKDGQKALHFVPLGPACVIIKVLIPVYGAYISSPSLWKSVLRAAILATGTFTFLAASKVVVGVLLQRYATWYLRRAVNRDKHHHAD